MVKIPAAQPSTCGIGYRLGGTIISTFALSGDHVVIKEDTKSFETSFCKSQQAKSLDYDLMRSTVAGPGADFAARIYKTIAENATGSGNIVLSPVSVHILLAMLLSGAKTKTAEEISAVIGVPTKDFHDLFGQTIALLTCPNEYEQMELSIANQVFRQTGKPLIGEFEKRLKDSYDSKVVDLDFQTKPKEAREQINVWVKEATRDKIPELLGNNVIDERTKLVLISTIYLKEAWEHVFSETRDLPFYGMTQEETKIPMMVRKGEAADYCYAELEGFQAASLSTSSNEIDLVIMLPNKRDGVADLENSLRGDLLRKTMESLSKQKVNLTIPRFKIEMNHSLEDRLAEVGMKTMFDPRTADFGGIDNHADLLYVSKIIQQATIDVNEKGLEAAAATAAIMRFGSAMPPPKEPVDFVADHPFLFLVKHRTTGIILFMGRVVDPSSK